MWRIRTHAVRSITWRSVIICSLSPADHSSDGGCPGTNSLAAFVCNEVGTGGFVQLNYNPPDRHYRLLTQVLPT